MQQDNGATQQPGLLALSKEFHNSGVERKPWAAAAFSHDLEYVAGATPEHKIYAWSLHSGRLEKMLEIDGEPRVIRCPCATAEPLIFWCLRMHSQSLYFQAGRF